MKADYGLPKASIDDATPEEWDAAYYKYIEAKKRASEQQLQDSLESLSQQDVDKLLNDPS